MMYLDPDSAERIKHLSEHYEMKPQYILKGLEDGHSLDQIEQFLILDDLLFKRNWSMDEIQRFRDRVLDMAYLYQQSYLELLRQGDLRTFEQATEKLDEIEAHLSEEAEAQIKEAPEVGKHRGVKNGRFDRSELLMGIEVEMEHTSDLETAREIAKDHLAEIPDYYTRLLKMEREAGIKSYHADNDMKEMEKFIKGKKKMTSKEIVMFASGTALATIMPTPADIVHFYWLKWINDNRYNLSPTRYWLYNAVDYYLVDWSWWAILLGFVLVSKKPVSEKAKLYFGMIAGGAVVGVLGKFVTEEQKHREELQKQVSSGGAQTMEQAEYVQQTTKQAPVPLNAPRIASQGPGTMNLRAPQVGYPNSSSRPQDGIDECKRACDKMYKNMAVIDELYGCYSRCRPPGR